MDEKPKSIWRKSWSLPGFFLIWLILTAATLLIVLAGILIIGGPFTQPKSFIGLLVFGAVAATILLWLWILIRWLFHWRNFKRFLFGLFCFVTLIALFYAEENWRGKHDWEKFKREWEAKGEHFDFASVIPPPVPDDQNFAFSPVWIAEEKYVFLNTPKKAEAWYGDRIYSDEVARIFTLLPVSVSAVVGTNWAYHLPSTPEMSGNWMMARATDLKPWQAYYRNLERSNSAAEISSTPPQSPAQDVLLALSKFDPVIEQLRQDSARPDSRFPIGYDMQPPATILLPHLAALKQFAQVLQLRAIAELKNNESQKALDDGKLSLRLTKSIRTEPFLICHLVRIAILQLALQPVWEGLAGHKWSDEQLAELDAEMAKIDFLTDYGVAMRGERGLVVGDIEWLQYNRSFRKLDEIGDDNRSDDVDHSFEHIAIALAYFLGPSGWFDQNKLRIARFETQWYLPLAEHQTISPKAVGDAGYAATLETGLNRTTPFNLLERMFLPALASAVKKFAQAQTSVDLARTAIALERYRLAHGNYPESLDVLVPQFIALVPHDIVGGQPLHYRRTDDGQFVLYSVGWNETDDGGVVVTDKKYGTVRQNEGDWVWRYPQK